MSEPVRRFPLRRSRRLRPRVRPRYRGPSFNRIVPNLMTMAGLCAGLTAMRFALDGRFDAAAVAITVAGVIDGLDGRLARLLKGTSRFGAEFDSLSDFACFGVAPCLTLYEWSLQRAGGLGYAACVLFAVCMALRLARFNAMSDAPPLPSYAYNFFTGVPAPAGAGLALFPVFLGLEANSLGWERLDAITRHPLLCAPILVGTAALLVSSLPVWSFKNFKVRAPTSRHKSVRSTFVRRPLGRPRRRWSPLSHDVAVQRPKLSPFAT
jgi:CDP-diacylglycerol--serine O-phosphatidyltransferase